MMRTMLTIVLPLVASGTLVGQAPAKWEIDQAHSRVMFNVTHLVISEVNGTFKSYTGNITASKADFSDAVVEFSVDVNSINTDNEKRDAHLKGEEFFNSVKFPNMTFKGTAMKSAGGNKYKLTGNLTIRDVTKPITLDVTYSGTVVDPWGNTKAGFKVKGTINRFDYGLKWNTLTEAGGAVVGQDVEMVVNLELSKAK